MTENIPDIRKIPISSDVPLIASSSQDILQLVDQTKSRKERTRLLTLTFSSEPKVARELRSNYGYTPEQFSILFAESYNELLKDLPEDYDLEVSINGDFGDIYVSNWIVSKAVIQEVETQLDTEAIHSKNNYKNYFEEKRKYYTEQPPMSQKLPASGFFWFALTKIKDDPEETDKESTGVVIEQLHSGLTHLALQSELEKEGVEIAKVCPTPLRWKDGAQVNISDAIRKTEENLITRIGTDQNHSAVLTTTPPSEDGERMLARQGYTTVDKLYFIGKDKRLFENSYMYERGIERGYRGKVVYLYTQAR